MKRILINAANLHNGGGVQVATSFIMELSGMVERFPDFNFMVYASTEVDANLASSGFDKDSVSRYAVFDVYGIQTLKPSLARRFEGFDLVFTIFGPFYRLTKLPNHVVGFAQPWIIYPENEISRSLSLGNRLRTKLKFWLQWVFFRREARLVVELGHVKNRLVELKRFPADSISVVSNCVSAVYFDQSRWAQLHGLDEGKDGIVRLGFVSRDYPHKNIDVLLEIAKVLKRISSLDYRLYVTLTDAEWQARSDEFRSTIVNVGPISVAQCPTFYSAVDAVVFPSLLECFSATPLEAMVMERPLFASDRGFVRDCCGEHAMYFDPLDAEEAAKKIDNWFSRLQDEERRLHVEGARKHVLSLPGSRKRAENYLHILSEMFNK